MALILGSLSAAESLKRYSLGISDDTVYWQESDEKSVSNEHTFGEDENSRSVVRARLLELVSHVGRRFRQKERWASTAKIKLRNAAFETLSRQTSFESPARDDITFREKAIALFDGIWPESETHRSGRSAARLIGFGVTNIRNTPEADLQPSLFEVNDGGAEKRKKRERLSETLDSLRKRGLI